MASILASSASLTRLVNPRGASTTSTRAAGKTKTFSFSKRTIPPQRVVVRTAATGDDQGGEATTENGGDAAASKAEKEEVLIDRNNLDATYYRGFLESEIGEEDNSTGRDKLEASMKLGATAVLGALTVGFMASNGLL